MDKIEISQKTIIFTLALLLGVWFVYQISSVLLIWYVSFVLANALNPMVAHMEKIKIPRPLAILLTFLMVIGVISIIVAGLIPILMDQTNILAKLVTKQLPNISVIQIDQKAIASQIESISRNAMGILHFIISAASNILTILLMFVLTFYMLIERKRIPGYLKNLFDKPDIEEKSEALLAAIEHRLGGWVRGEILLMGVIGLMTYIGLLLLGIPYALPLALVAGLLELVPNVGPIISSIPAILVALTFSPALAVGVAILYICVQQLENNLIVPMVMRQSVGLPPMITLMCLMVGMTIGGVGGALLAVPTFITIEVILRFFHRRNRQKKGLLGL